MEKMFLLKNGGFMNFFKLSRFVLILFLAGACAQPVLAMRDLATDDDLATDNDYFGQPMEEFQTFPKLDQSSMNQEDDLPNNPGDMGSYSNADFETYQKPPLAELALRRNSRTEEELNDPWMSLGDDKNNSSNSHSNNSHSNSSYSNSSHSNGSHSHSSQASAPYAPDLSLDQMQSFDQDQFADQFVDYSKVAPAKEQIAQQPQPPLANYGGQQTPAATVNAQQQQQQALQMIQQQQALQMIQQQQALQMIQQQQAIQMLQQQQAFQQQTQLSGDSKDSKESRTTPVPQSFQQLFQPTWLSQPAPQQAQSASSSSAPMELDQPDAAPAPASSFSSSSSSSSAARQQFKPVTSQTPQQHVSPHPLLEQIRALRQSPKLAAQMQRDPSYLQRAVQKAVQEVNQRRKTPNSSSSSSSSTVRHQQAQAAQPQIPAPLFMPIASANGNSNSNSAPTTPKTPRVPTSAELLKLSKLTDAFHDQLCKQEGVDTDSDNEEETHKQKRQRKPSLKASQANNSNSNSNSNSRSSNSNSRSSNSNSRSSNSNDMKKSGVYKITCTGGCKASWTEYLSKKDLEDYDPAIAMCSSCDEKQKQKSHQKPTRKRKAKEFENDDAVEESKPKKVRTRKGGRFAPNAQKPKKESAQSDSTVSGPMVVDQGDVKVAKPKMKKSTGVNVRCSEPHCPFTLTVTPDELTKVLKTGRTKSKLTCKDFNSLQDDNQYVCGFSLKCRTCWKWVDKNSEKNTTYKSEDARKEFVCDKCTEKDEEAEESEREDSDEEMIDADEGEASEYDSESDEEMADKKKPGKAKSQAKNPHTTVTCAENACRFVSSMKKRDALAKQLKKDVSELTCKDFGRKCKGRKLKMSFYKQKYGQA